MGRAERVRAHLKKAETQDKEHRQAKKDKKSFLALLPALIDPEELNVAGFNKLWRTSEDPVSDLMYLYPGAAWEDICAYAGAAVRLHDIVNPKKCINLPLLKYFRKHAPGKPDGIYVVFSCVGYKEPWVLTNKHLPTLPAMMPYISMQARGLSNDIKVLSSTYLLPQED
jgi:hypothetical protein